MIATKKSKIFITSSTKETQKLGKNLAKEILKQKKGKKAIVVVLEGELGSGKTTFLQGFAKGLGIKEKITSPTFVIFKKFQIQNYKLQTNSKFRIQNSKFFYHVDCYRIEGIKDLLNLGWQDIIKNPANIVAVEWAEKIKEILPKTAIKIKFKFIDKKTREIAILKPNVKHL